MSNRVALFPMKESVGQQLRHAREARALSLEQVSRATLIRVHYLQALETGQFNALPSEVQGRGFLRAYAAYLGLSADALLAELDDRPVEAAQPPPAPAKEAAGAQDETVEAIYADIGQRLKRQRELLGLTLEDVERHTHLRQHYLRALEAGDLAGLPSPVQGRGMLSNYANFLGMDAEPLLLRFAQGLQVQLAARQATRPAPARRVQQQPKPPGPLRRVLSGESLLGTLLVIALVGFMIWAAVRIYAMQATEVPSPTAPSIAEVLLLPPTPTDTLAPLPTPTPPPLPLPTTEAESTAVFAVLPEGTQGLQVYVTVRQRAWLQVTADGEVVFLGRVLPGSAYQFEGDETVEILTGNGAALQVFFNQVDQGTLGGYGEVVQLVYTAEGVQTPTPTITFTPTETQRPAETQGAPPTASP
jgi:cytoskeletal protein RodZ